ncbi:hypothetical protein DPEC_G00083700 [Dallia pectoralis]|uniref:Uncharacterized protein n=1 Tax=Dallia pectoralis TaxID=75939 RepID=A0ACC2GZF4_DALPE|nr:hypothetical protein DPEC_G00083700 [Dallia pectoralis]
MFSRRGLALINMDDKRRGQSSQLTMLLEPCPITGRLPSGPRSRDMTPRWGWTEGLGWMSGAEPQQQPYRPVDARPPWGVPNGAYIDPGPGAPTMGLMGKAALTPGKRRKTQTILFYLLERVHKPPHYTP